MRTWFISHKRVDNGRIAQVKVSLALGSTSGTSVTREQVILWITNGTSEFFTQVGGKQGAKVKVISVRGTSYLRTDSNQRPADNLGNLPDF